VVVDTRQAYDSLLLLYVVIAVVSAAIIYAWMAFAILRYRDRGAGGGAGVEGGGDPPAAGGPAGAAPPEGVAKRPVAIMSLAVTAILLSLTVNGINAFTVISEPPTVPEGSVHVHAIAFQFGWAFTYENGNTTNGVMYAPAGRVVEVTVTADDVFHSFGLPDYRVKADAIPGQVNELWFLAGSPGSHPIYCMELCGTGHNSMHAVLQVLPQAEWDAWVAGYTA
jgi:cytochrome c oxidase subunit 2